MTDCNRDPLDFSSLGSKAVVADFRADGSPPTAVPSCSARSPTGSASSTPSTRRSPTPVIRFIVHDQRTMLAQRVIAIALGYEDLNDHQTLRADPALQVAAGKPPEATALASPPTLCRLENRVDRKTLVKIAEVLVDQFIAAHPDAARTPDPRLRRHRRPHPRQAGGPLLPRIL